MRAAVLLVVLCGLLSACQRRHDSGTAPAYSQGSTNAEVRAGADATATDTRPTGGSMAGAGGAGPGYDGSAHGLGKHGTIPGLGAGFASGLTNASSDTNQPGATPSGAAGGKQK